MALYFGIRALMNRRGLWVAYATELYRDTQGLLGYGSVDDINPGLP